MSDTAGADPGGPPGEAAAAPERTCIVTRASGPAAALIRFVLSPDGEVVPDLAETLPGRGAWVTGTSALLADAVKRGAFARSFKKPARAAPDLPDRVGALLKRRALEALAIANKAGLVIAGFAKIEAKMREKPIAALAHAKEAGVDGRRKLDAAATRSRRGGAQTARVAGLFTSGELDGVLGRSNVTHAAILHGGAARMFLERAHRLAHFYGGKSGELDVLGEADGPLEGQ